MMNKRVVTLISVAVFTGILIGVVYLISNPSDEADISDHTEKIEKKPEQTSENKGQVEENGDEEQDISENEQPDEPDDQIDEEDAYSSERALTTQSASMDLRSPPYLENEKLTDLDTQNFEGEVTDELIDYFDKLIANGNEHEFYLALHQLNFLGKSHVVNPNWNQWQHLREEARRRALRSDLQSRPGGDRGRTIGEQAYSTLMNPGFPGWEEHYETLLTDLQRVPDAGIRKAGFESAANFSSERVIERLKIRGYNKEQARQMELGRLESVQNALEDEMTRWERGTEEYSDYENILDRIQNRIEGFKQ